MCYPCKVIVMNSMTYIEKSHILCFSQYSKVTFSLLISSKHKSRDKETRYANLFQLTFDLMPVHAWDCVHMIVRNIITLQNQSMKKTKVKYMHVLLNMYGTSTSFSLSSLVVHFHSNHTALVQLGPVRSTLGSSQVLCNHV